MTQRNMKENQSVMPIIADDFSTVTFRTRGQPDIVLHMDRLHPGILKRAACSGMAQVRIVDAAAIPATDKDGNIIPADERQRMKYERMAALVEHYETGTDQWSRVSEGGGGKSLTVEAIARVKGWTYEQAEAEVEKLADKHHGGDTKKCLAFLRGGKAVSEAMRAIREERAPAPKVDADKALAELGQS